MSALSDPSNLFTHLGGKKAPEKEALFEAPVIDALSYKTDAGTMYLKDPGVALFVRPMVNLEALRGFLNGFDRDLEFDDYLDDAPIGAGEDGELDLLDEQAGAEVTKVAGQLCYMSFGPERTLNRDAGKYLENIRTQRHGSVLEHPNYTFLLYGAGRAFTHELVRHRVGVAYSQVSQRFVDGKVLRFVERRWTRSGEPEGYSEFNL